MLNEFLDVLIDKFSYQLLSYHVNFNHKNEVVLRLTLLSKAFYRFNKKEFEKSKVK
jgi:hypothetical protein